MHGGWRSRALVVALFLVATAALGVGVWRYGYVQALGGLAKRGAADLALASDRVVGQLQRYRELAVLMADHPVVDALATGAEPSAASALFEEVADKTGALEVLFVDRSGAIRAAARGTAHRDVSEVPFVWRAMNGALGTGHGAGSLVDARAYYFASPNFGPDAKVRGAVIVAANIDEIEWNWAGSNPPVFFIDERGEVFITNRSELTYWRRSDNGHGLLAPNGTDRPFALRWVGGHEIWRLDWGPYLPMRALHVRQELPVINMTAEALIDTGPALRLAGVQAMAVSALCLAFGALLFLATERRRTLAEANVRLEARVAARTEALSQTNVALRREIAEREEAEAALRRAQQDLVQAGKLSALGQMSAGISHELNQPLMAIQTFSANAMALFDKGRTELARENLGRISELAQRMGRIIRNLRAFARQESAPVARVDLVKVLSSAIELTERKVSDGGVTLHAELPVDPLWVKGGEVRLCQVFVNLVSNAVDAMAASDRRDLTLRTRDGARLVVEVADTGPGIDMPDKMFEPFYSTKADTGQDGMGLGLSISYGIVQSFGGEIRGMNSPDGGAVFTVELERWSDDTERAA